MFQLLAIIFMIFVAGSCGLAAFFALPLGHAAPVQMLGYQMDLFGQHGRAPTWEITRVEH